LLAQTSAKISPCKPKVLATSSSSWEEEEEDWRRTRRRRRRRRRGRSWHGLL